MLPRASLVVFLFPLAVPLAAQGVANLRLNELMVDPVGPNAGAQVVEVLVAVPQDLTGWHLASGSGSAALPSLRIQPNNVTRIHLGATGTNTPADLYLPAFPVLGPADSLAVFRSASFTANELEDYVSWGGGQAFVTEAIQAGQWPSTLLSVPPPVTEGHSLAHFGPSSFVGPDHPDAWYDDGTPTLGLPNDYGAIFNLGLGCPGLGALAPGLGAAVAVSRPWIGERLEVDLWNLAPGQGLALLVLSPTSTPPVPLGAFGMPGCNSHVGFDFVVGLPSNLGRSRFVSSVPADPRLTGSMFHAQALVPTPAAGNALGALVSNAITCVVGSR